MRFMHTRDRDEKVLLVALAEAGLRLADTMQRNLAAHIVNTYAKARR